jgi:hypothetical protein
VLSSGQLPAISRQISQELANIREHGQGLNEWDFQRAAAASANNRRAKKRCSRNSTHQDRLDLSLLRLWVSNVWNLTTAHFLGLSPRIGVINWFNQSKSGDGLMQRNVFALFGVVAVLLTATMALTISRATLTAGGVGSLKCYDKGGIEKAC